MSDFNNFLRSLVLPRDISAGEILEEILEKKGINGAFFAPDICEHMQRIYKEQYNNFLYHDDFFVTGSNYIFLYENAIEMGYGDITLDVLELKTGKEVISFRSVHGDCGADEIHYITIDGEKLAYDGISYEQGMKLLYAALNALKIENLDEPIVGYFKEKHHRLPKFLDGGFMYYLPTKEMPETAPREA
jgi:hypothetical protein